MRSFALSDIGLHREQNEDAWIALPEIGFFALADGMGGHQAGEIASKEAIGYLSSLVKKIEQKDPFALIEEIRDAIEKSNQRIHQLGKESAHWYGMGTTLCCLFWTPAAVIYAHVGDSRIYRLRKQKLQLLTQDHSFWTKWLATGKLAEECQTPYPYRNVLTRAIGGPGKANPEVAATVPEEGDLYLLCTDGLSDVFPFEEIEECLNTCCELSTMATLLIEKAKNKGSSDNMTVLLIQKNLYHDRLKSSLFG